jgi:hypothetical protein
MADTVANFLIARLTEWSVRRIYGYPGDGINSITTTLRKAGGTEEGESRLNERRIGCPRGSMDRTRRLR